MKYIKLILVFTFLSSCITNKSIVGLYGKCGNGYLACTQIELKADKTFEYFIFMDVGGASLTKGTWKINSNDTIVLNTYNQPENPKTLYIGKINSELIDKVKIRVSDKNGPIEFTIVQINDKKQGKQTDSNGFVEFNTQVLRNIEYSYLFQEEVIQIDNPNYNEVEILIKDLDLNSVPEYLTDYKIIVDGKQLFLDSRYSLKKTKLNKKQWK